MLSKVAILGALIVALYSPDPQAWNFFYITVFIATLRAIVSFIAHRRKFSKLVFPPPDDPRGLIEAGSTAFDVLGSFEMDRPRNGREGDVD